MFCAVCFATYSTLQHLILQLQDCLRFITHLALSFHYCDEFLCRRKPECFNNLNMSFCKKISLLSFEKWATTFAQKINEKQCTCWQSEIKKHVKLYLMYACVMLNITLCRHNRCTAQTLILLSVIMSVLVPAATKQ